MESKWHVRVEFNYDSTQYKNTEPFLFEEFTKCSENKTVTLSWWNTTQRFYTLTTSKTKDFR